MNRRVIAALVIALLASGALFLVASSPDQARAQDPVRIMLLGDSVTKGGEGDWTWRYRLWTHLKATGASVDFVGPYDGLYNLGDIVSPPSHDYVDPDFDQDHAALEGARYEARDIPIAELVADYRPDILVVMMGVNDVVFGGASGAEVDQRMRQLVAEARAADPEIDLVIARTPQVWFPGVVDFNELVPDTVAELDDNDSRMVTAYADEGFATPDHVWDFAHPNAAGDVMVAAAMADALAELGVGAAFPRPLPAVPLGPRFAPTLEAVASDARVTLRWVRPPGVEGELVWMRDASTGEAWHELPDPVPEQGVRGSESVWSASELVNGHTYEFQLRPVRGYWPAEDDIRSNVVSATPQLATPLAPALEQVTVFGTATLSWAAVEGATSYQVLQRSTPADTWQVRKSTAETRAVVGRLPGRETYELAVRAARDGVVGPASDPVSARIPAPRAVREVRAVPVRKGRVRVRGLEVPEAMSYRLLLRKVSSCRGTSAGASLPTVRWGLTEPRVTLRVTAPAVWVRLVAVRSGVLGRVAPDSTSCVRLR